MTKDSITAKLAGKFIVLDGPDGCGKSTQVKLLAERLTAAGVAVETLRDPGSTAVGDSIREILLGKDHEDRAIHCELMLFMASRAQMVATKIKPALAAGKTVLCDRYVSSSCAYQGALGLNVGEILDIADFATQKVWPNLTILLDISAEAGLARITAGRNGIHDAMERRGLEYHKKVREIFLKLPEIYPRTAWVVNADDTIENVQAKVVEVLTCVDY